MLSLKYDPVYGADYYFGGYRPNPDYRTRRPIEYYFNWPWKYRYWFTNQRFRRNLYKELRIKKFTYLDSNGIGTGSFSRFMQMKDEHGIKLNPPSDVPSLRQNHDTEGTCYNLGLYRLFN